MTEGVSLWHSVWLRATKHYTLKTYKRRCAQTPIYKGRWAKTSIVKSERDNSQSDFETQILCDNINHMALLGRQILFPHLRYDEASHGWLVSLGLGCAQYEILEDYPSVNEPPDRAKALRDARDTVEGVLTEQGISVNFPLVGSIVSDICDILQFQPSDWFTALFIIANAASLLFFLETDDTRTLARRRLDMINEKCPNIRSELDIPAIWRELRDQVRPNNLRSFWRERQTPLTILIVAADPAWSNAQRRQLDREAIEEAMLLIRYRIRTAGYTIEETFGNSPQHLAAALQRHKPDVVIFSAPGANRALYTQKRSESRATSNPTALGGALRSAGVRGVILNGWYEPEYARRLVAATGRSVWSILNAVVDSYSVALYRGFFDQFINGSSFESAVDETSSHVQLDLFPGASEPYLFRAHRTRIVYGS